MEDKLAPDLSRRFELLKLAASILANDSVFHSGHGRYATDHWASIKADEISSLAAQLGRVLGQ